MALDPVGRVASVLRRSGGYVLRGHPTKAEGNASPSPGSSTVPGAETAATEGHGRQQHVPTMCQHGLYIRHGLNWYTLNRRSLFGVLHHKIATCPSWLPPKPHSFHLLISKRVAPSHHSQDGFPLSTILSQALHF